VVPASKSGLDVGQVVLIELYRSTRAGGWVLRSSGEFVSLHSLHWKGVKEWGSRTKHDPELSNIRTPRPRMERQANRQGAGQR
jgi:hypothetical protein